MACLVHLKFPINGDTYLCKFVKEDGQMCKVTKNNAVKICHHLTTEHKFKIFHIDSFHRLIEITWKKGIEGCARKRYHCKFCDKTFSCRKELAKFRRHILYEFGLSQSDDETRDKKLTGNIQRFRDVLGKYPPNVMKEIFADPNSKTATGYHVIISAEEFMTDDESGDELEIENQLSGEENSE